MYHDGQNYVAVAPPQIKVNSTKGRHLLVNFVAFIVCSFSLIGRFGKSIS